MRTTLTIVWGLLAGIAIATTAASAGEVTGLTLIDAATDRPIGPIVDGQTIDATKTGLFNIRADVAGDVGSVQWHLDGAAGKTESVAPFAIGGDNDGNYNGWNPPAGEHRIKATPYPQANGQGPAGKALELKVKFVGVARAAAVNTPSAYDDIESDEEMLPLAAPVGGEAVVGGEPKRWHKVTLTFEGPESSETAKPNPNLHYRLNVLFRQGDQTFVVPGYYAGDGEGGERGNKWRVHFAPPTTGQWSYVASFRAGYRVNIDTDPAAGAATACDGARGTFVAAASDKSGRDFRASEKGLLINRGHHYLTFGGSGRPWIKAGPDIPENFLGYDGFDNTPKAGHRFLDHAQDWRPGDPDWNDGAGRRIVGALNYIAQQGGNCIYFLPMNIGGDGKDTFPTIAPSEKTRYDNSKCDQWEILFQHAQTQGIFLHFQLAETEQACEGYHDGGELGPERKLYYREMIARFGHHNGLQYNIGEENDYGTERRVAFANYIRAVDPYDHPIANHTHGGKAERCYDPMLEMIADGKPVALDMSSFQDGRSGMQLAALVIRFREMTEAVGQPWVLSLDEPQPIHNDKNDLERGYDMGRRRKMWPVFMSGGAGFEWYVQKDGGGHSFDHAIESYRDMDGALAWSGHASDLLMSLPLLEMAPCHERGSAADGDTYVLAKPGAIYVLYNDTCGKEFSIDLSGVDGPFAVTWFNPRSGEKKAGEVERVRGGEVCRLGSAPEAADRDWACLLQKK